jgi:hypothetical protein
MSDTPQIFTSIARKLNVEAMGGDPQNLNTNEQHVDLEKGMIGNMFDSNTFSASIKGDRIKEAMESTLQRVNSKIESQEEYVSKCLAECTDSGCTAPDAKIESWMTQGIESQIELPMIFPHKTICGFYEAANPGGNSYPTEDYCCNKYNAAVFQLVQMITDKAILEPIVTTLDETRYYYMSPRQMALIGLK